ncbi:MAG: ribosome assembly RNA-binding protein YhbY [Treponemataceae bacterium]|nr:ribosome assembly RNA-binding protein YhbY [Treponemataceae bacterium]
MEELTSKQRKVFEKMAHSLEPVVIIGGAGASEGLVKMIDKCLTDHELIKVKFNEYKDEKREIAENISKELDATLVRIIGNIAIFYRKNPEKED